MLTKLKELRESREEGFTLVELLVVIIIIGILAAIALPIFLNQQKQAADATLKSDIKTAALAVTAYTAKTGKKLNEIPTFGSFQYSYMANNTDTALWPNSARIEQGVLSDWITVSEGTRLGIKILDGNTGFCVIGVNNGGTYLGGSSGELDKRAALFYDSTVGKVQEWSELKPNGGCSYFVA